MPEMSEQMTQMLRCIEASGQGGGPNTELARWVLEDPQPRIISLMGLATVLCVWVPGLMDNFTAIVTETKDFADNELEQKGIKFHG